jgi:hypothetical protein
MGRTTSSDSSLQYRNPSFVSVGSARIQRYSVISGTSFLRYIHHRFIGRLGKLEKGSLTGGRSWPADSCRLAAAIPFDSTLNSWTSLGLCSVGWIFQI